MSENSHHECIVHLLKLMESFELRDKHEKMSENSRIVHLVKLMEQFKSDVATSIGPLSMQSILNHPYPPNSSVPIPHEMQHDEKLLEMWPQIEQKILEWRKIVYLMSYLLRARLENPSPGIESNRDIVVKLRSGDEKTIPDDSFFEPYYAAVLDAFVQHDMEFDAQVREHEEQARAYAEENNDVASMEWYAEQASGYLPSPSVMLEKMGRLPSNLPRLTMPVLATLLRRPSNENMIKQVYRLMQQIQQQQQQQQQQQHESQGWGAKGIMNIRMASSWL